MELFTYKQARREIRKKPNAKQEIEKPESGHSKHTLGPKNGTLGRSGLTLEGTGVENTLVSVDGIHFSTKI